MLIIKTELNAKLISHVEYILCVIYRAEVYCIYTFR